MKAKNINLILGAILVFLMLAFEARYYLPKIIIMCILLCMNFEQIRLSPKVIKLYIPLCLSTLIGVIGGMLRGHEQSLNGITTGVVWPILSMLIATPILFRRESYDYLIKILFIIHSFLVMYDLIFSLSIIYGFPCINIYPEIEIPFSFYGITSRMNFTNLNVLTFTIPIFFMIWLTRYNILIPRILQSIVLLLSFFLLILSGRRSLMIIFPLAPIVAIVMGKQLSRDRVNTVYRYMLFFISLLVVFVVYYYITAPDVFEGYLFTFKKAFDSDEEPIKFIQAKQLFNTFKEYPIFGAGAGFKLYESIRGIWKYQFELTYLFILASRGIVGFVLYLMGVIGPFWVGLKYAKKHNDQLFLFILIGYFFILLADATNPVLCSFDLMLPLYLCYSKINSLIFCNSSK